MRITKATQLREEEKREADLCESDENLNEQMKKTE